MVKFARCKASTCVYSVHGVARPNHLFRLEFFHSSCDLTVVYGYTLSFAFPVESRLDWGNQKLHSWSFCKNSDSCSHEGMRRMLITFVLAFVMLIEAAVVCIAVENVESNAKKKHDFLVMLF
eukprot:Gb_01423 [translate_table: standard]